MRDLPDEAIETFVHFAECCTSPRSLAILEHAHGAVARVQPEATAFTARTEPFDLVLISLWNNPAEDAQHIDWTRRFYTGMQPWSAGSVYVNGMDQDDASRVPDAYGRNYARLCEIKAKYDPENRFRRNQNIQPQRQATA
jgi:FAD/FMN-containing dehydrogenase